MRKFVCAAVVVVFACSVVMADEFGFIITKAEGNKITGFKTKDKDRKEVTLTRTKDCKVAKGVLNKDTKKVEAGEALPAGALRERITKSDGKGVVTRVTTNKDDAVTQILVIGKKGGKTDKN